MLCSRPHTQAAECKGQARCTQPRPLYYFELSLLPGFVLPLLVFFIYISASDAGRPLKMAHFVFIPRKAHLGPYRSIWLASSRRRTWRFVWSPFLFRRALFSTFAWPLDGRPVSLSWGFMISWMMTGQGRKIHRGASPVRGATASALIGAAIV